MSKLMELVEEYGFACLCAAPSEQALHAKVRSAVAELERDAARYRYLVGLHFGHDLEWRLTDESEPKPVLLFRMTDHLRHVYSVAMMDEAIDAAMEAGNG